MGISGKFGVALLVLACVRAGSYAAPPDREAPSVPTGVTASSASCSQINLSWKASTDSGGSGLEAYKVYRSASFLKQVTTTSTSDTGLSGSTIYFGGEGLTSAGGSDIFVEQFSAGGTHVWSKRAGGDYNDHGNAIAFDGSGNVFDAGDFYTQANFGGATMYSPGGTDAYLVKFAP